MKTIEGELKTKSGKVILEPGNYTVRKGTRKAPGYDSSYIIKIQSSFTADVKEHPLFYPKYSSKDGGCYISISGGLLNKLKSYGVDAKFGWIMVRTDKKVRMEVEIAKPKTEPNTTNTDTGQTTGDNTAATDSGADIEYTTLDATYSGYSLDTDVDVDTNIGDLMADSMHGIFGLPYQWDEIADRRMVDESGKTLNFGRKYSEKIAARMPLVFFTPGRPSFMPGSDDESKDNILSILTEKMIGDESKINESLDELLDVKNTGAKKFYALNFAQEEYFRYVNPMCQIMAKYMDLDKDYNMKIGKKNTVNFTKFDWSQALTDGFTKYWSSASAIPFYVDAASSASDSFSNDTTQSWLAGQVGGLSSKAKEMQFLVGTADRATDGAGLIGLAVDAISGLKDKLTSLTTSKSGSDMLANVGSSLVAIAQGGSMIFPEIWDNSSVGRSYSINIKLRSPDCDNLSLYLNIMVPFIHCLCMCAPQMMGNNVNTYSSPFLVRAYCKSMFNIDMGIITSMDVSRGKEGAWNSNGIPTEMDITLNIKDLYDVFSITGWDNSIKLSSIFATKKNSSLQIIKNTAMMDYLGNLAGLNLNQPEVTRNIQSYIMLTNNRVRNWPNRQWMRLQQAVDSRLYKLYRPGSV